MIGRQLGDYKILEAVGGGSFGTVYRAEHVRSGNRVAIKLLHLSIASAESQRVINEARAAVAISHPNVIKIYDLALTSDRRPYIVMQLLEGAPLSRVLERGVSTELAVAMASDILRGLAAAHARGVIHRDLKPDNIFVEHGRAVIVDFGLAKLLADPRAANMTATGEAIGTPHYMAPEQIRNSNVDHRADLYAVGCMLYQMLAGRPPFDATAPFLLFDAHINHAPPQIPRTDLPPHLSAAVMRALAKDPAERFQDADSMRRALSSPAAKRVRKWPLVVAPIVLGGVIAAVALHREPPAAAVGSVATKREIPYPSPKPGEPTIDPRLENTLVQMHDLMQKGMYTRSTAVMMLCKFDEAAHTPSAPSSYRAYLRRCAELFRTGFPDIDVATECHR